MAERKLKIVVACGGTGGHTYPGLAVAQELIARGHDVTVWTSGRNIEGSVLKGWEGNVFQTLARPLAPRNVFANVRAILRCLREMKRTKAQVLLAMGSYASLPPVLAARLCGVGVVLHEANAVPGRAVDYLKRLARVICISFPQTAHYLAGYRTVITGLPVRANTVGGEPFAGIPKDSFRIFITGGSQGAHAVNELMIKALPILKKLLEEKPLYVMHQTGVADEEGVRKAYEAAGIPARVVAFEQEMARALASADIIVARAGASTCFELALTGKPAFLIPHPTALRNHQHLNAQAFVESGAADEGDQAQITPRVVANLLLAKARNPAQLATMAQKMRQMAIPNAAARVADLVEQNALSPNSTND